MAKKGQSNEAEAKAEVVEALKVEINFPVISDLKQAIGMDTNGQLVVRVQFQARADQFEIFRLNNLLRQPHGALYAVIGTPQGALDFQFDEKNLKFQIFKAAKQLETPKQVELPEETTATGVENATNQSVKVEEVTFNHRPDDEQPFGVFIAYSANGLEESKTAAGRGLTPMEAVIAGVKQCGAITGELSEPFEVRAALELLEPSPELYKLIRVLDVGTFDDNEKGEDTPKGEDKPEGEEKPEAEKD